jgi:hypothetical protein
MSECCGVGQAFYQAQGLGARPLEHFGKWTPNMQDFMQIISRRPNAINVDMTRFCFCINEVLKTLKKRTARSLERQGIAEFANVTKRDCVTLFMQPLNNYTTAEKGAGEGLRPAGRQARFKSAYQKIILTLSD